MTHKVGIWIDQKGAVLVTAHADGANIEHVTSKVEDSRHATGGVRGAQPFVHRSVNSGARQQKRRQNELRAFFKELEPKLRSCDKLLVLGQGPVKESFVNFLEDEGLSERLAAVSKCQRLTDNQLAEKVQTWFGYAPPRDLPSNARL